MMYLDDLNPEDLTDEQKEEFRKMFEEDPYHFYNLWRDPDAAQRYFEGDDFKTTPASEVYLKLAALKTAGAPQDVVDAWSDTLKNKGRPSEKVDPNFLPKTKPIVWKLEQIDTLCRHINEDLNYTVDNVTPDPDDFPDVLPFATKWHQIMNKAMGAPDIEEHHDGSAKHYKATDSTGAAFGVEILEIKLAAPKADINLEDCFDNPFLEEGEESPPSVYPSGMTVERNDQITTIKLEYFNCYE